MVNDKMDRSFLSSSLGFLAPLKTYFVRSDSSFSHNVGKDLGPAKSSPRLLWLSLSR